MLLSKRPERFLPGLWPTYFSKAKGCTVWDLDGAKLLDFSLMGIGTNILGYGDRRVDEAVRRTVSAGNMSTLNAPEDVQLAQMLVDRNEWADSVKLARTGGEANTIALRIGRAASGRDGVAVCGYHGWHDWYLSANLGDTEALDGHLLPGLEPRGVPRNLAGLVKTFQFNDSAALNQILSEGEIGVLFMEVSRESSPSEKFLHEVRSKCSEKGVVLIFDECTSGFRETNMGLHKKYNVEPDMAVYGKALGNGYAITAVVGRQSVMDTAQSTFISSTFWTERIGTSAAIASLDQMERLKSWDEVTRIGAEIKRGWQRISSESGLGIAVRGLDALASFNFLDTQNDDVFRTFVTQEMLRRGFLASNTVYASVAHRDNLISLYLEQLFEVFLRIKDLGADGVNMSLETSPASVGFKRLT